MLHLAAAALLFCSAPQEKAKAADDAEETVAAKKGNLTPVYELEAVYATNLHAPLALTQLALPHMDEGATILNVTSDAAVEAYEGWGGYGSSKAALEQLTRVLAVEHPQLRIHAVDPGDMRTAMHQDAFPDEDISDRPLPRTVVPHLLELLEQRPSSGRYRAADIAVKVGA